jgi:hypothetical protein
MNTKSRINKSVVVEGLTEARERTRLLLEGVSEEDLLAQHDPIMSPLIWGSFKKPTARSSPSASSTTCTTPRFTPARSGPH